MMFAVIGAANHMTSEAMRLLNRFSSGDGGGMRDDAGDRPAFGGRPSGGYPERPQAPAGGAGGSGAPGGGQMAPAGGSQDEPDFGDPFADQ